ncbi:histidinol-phosphatase [Pectobacterium parmentieri]|uniref:Histidinol-phosphatase n=2 Tax=Pectobacterium parmentieri TaxID=1905730 RepID=A0ABS0RYI7_PECPM|nr:histidinol-phosphatase [Pectobacterium parmentieri]MBI0471270.1 histidinol-phosphatase [Pectobacterium parmentieri]MBI0493882.1 histidinol-phosphatase [Pectobacterium parmentieri]MBI0554696.1 histidinol-phosphatase [Pectobacterium parmentieri]MBI0568148.1 histidinol-phosphatase [Pectobacterium parmentieri]MBI0573117.1 histidinol-phosphatase [Pectobacterium parmentieri]
MIDSHSHTFYSKHAVGSVDELVCASISAGVTVLTITDHAPFMVDSSNRLLEVELEQYFTDIDNARHAYRGDITLLSGLELDYMPGTEHYTRELLARYPLDFAIGSIHYVTLDHEPMVKVWELQRLSEAVFLQRYFDSVQQLLESGLFDAIGHADSLLRGISETRYLHYIEPLLATLVQSGVAWECNTSGLRKTTLDPALGKEVKGLWSYPSRNLLTQLIELKVPFTIGSDVHDPRDAGAGIAELMPELRRLGLQHLSYFHQRQRTDITLDTLLLINEPESKTGILR